jgi:DNA-binding response OmpR family regulator
MSRYIHLPELIARLNALLRRGSGSAAGLLVHNDLSLNPASAEVRIGDEAIDVTALEYKLLRYFMQRPRHIVSQSELIDHLYSLDDMRESNTIEVYISRLRRKIGHDRIKTVRGLGYKLG